MTKQQRLILIISIITSFIAFLDQSVVNVALPAISNELGGGLATKQWVVDAYMVTLGALILVAGSLSDRFRRQRVLKIGLIGFGTASILCAAAPTDWFLIVARALQGAGAALLVPGALALIMSNFPGSEKSKAIGLWTAWTGIASLVGPLLGGVLVATWSWRLVFLINTVPIIVALWLLHRLQLTEQKKSGSKVDVLGAILVTGGLGATVFALIEGPKGSFGSPLILTMIAVGVILLAGFVLQESRSRQPMLPLGLFRKRNFSVGNIATLSIYAGLALSTFLIVVFLQQVDHYSAIMAGLAFLPTSILMFALSSKFGEWAGKHGPRLFMSVGPIVAGLGALSLLLVQTPVNYWLQVFPGVTIFGLGLATTVAPLTSAVLSPIPEEQSGIASAVSSAVARVAGLLAVASIGLFAGSSLDTAGFHRGVIVMAVLLAVGGVISAVGIRNPD